MHYKKIKEKHLELNSVDPSQWVIKYADYLFAFALLRLNDSDLAGDLVQETFLAALEKIGHFERRCTEKTWLTSILKNKIFDIYRQKSSGPKNGFTRIDINGDHNFFQQESGHWKLDKRPRELMINDPDPLENKELQDILKKCLKRLPPFWNTVFSMKFMDEKATSKICKELKITSSNYWVIIHRAKINLRDCLQRHWG